MLPHRHGRACPGYPRVFPRYEERGCSGRAGVPRVCGSTCDRHRMSEALLTPIEIGLTAAIVAIEGHEPLILTARGSDGLAGLPFGPFDALAHRTFDIGLRAWVEEQTGLRLGYVEQLYTFGDRGRHAEAGDTGAHMVSIGYLA